MSTRSAAAFAALVAGCAAVTAAPIYQVKDINSGSGNGVQFKPMAELDGKLVFWGFDPATGPAGQPWISDGTPAGTLPIATIAGTTGSLPAFDWTSSNGRVFFILNDSFTGIELWTTDGTQPGTVRLTDISPGSSGNSNIRQTDPSPSGAYFVGASPGGSSPDRVWLSDGTPVGTVSPLSGYQTNYLTEFATVDGRLFFFGSPWPAISATGLYRTDGTAPNTVAYTGAISLPSSPRAVNDRIYYTAGSTAGGREVWTATSVGTTTTQLKDIVSGAADSTPASLFRADDRLYFTASTPSSGRELWKSDGTDATTLQVSEIGAGILDAGVNPIGAIDGVLYFSADDGVHGNELWRSDGTAAGTYLVRDIDPDASSGIAAFARGTAVGKYLYFVGSGPVGPSTLWTTDGTASGTRAVDTSVFVSSNARFTAANGRLFFDATTTSGQELHAVDLVALNGPQWCKTIDQPMRDSGTVTSTFRLPSGATIADLNVSLDIGHTWIGDLVVTLTHVDTATNVILLDRPGRLATGSGCGGKLADIMLDDSAAGVAESACTATRPAYPRDRAFRPNNPLSAFAGQNLGGEWTLTLQDAATDDFGTLHEWCLYFNDTIFAAGFQ